MATNPHERLVDALDLLEAYQPNSGLRVRIEQFIAKHGDVAAVGAVLGIAHLFLHLVVLADVASGAVAPGGEDAQRAAVIDAWRDSYQDVGAAELIDDVDGFLRDITDERPDG